MLEKFRKDKGFWLKLWGLNLFFIIIFINFPNISSGADYPTKPIQIIIPATPGGTSDNVARIINNKLSSLLGQPVVIVNKPGAGCFIGIHYVKHAKPDGYTLLLTGPPVITGPLFTKAFTVDVLKDFIMINLPVDSPVIVAVKKDAPG